VYEGESTEVSLVNLLPVIDEHHGLTADRATDVVLEVRDAPFIENIRSQLATFGPFDSQRDRSPATGRLELDDLDARLDRGERENPT
jgi:hypothetical protein